MCVRGDQYVSVCVGGSVCVNMYICDYQCEFESVVLFFFGGWGEAGGL